MRGHPNIVYYYGAAKYLDGDNVIPLLVMERCTMDLKSRVIKEPKSDHTILRNPGKWPGEVIALDYFKDIATQLCEGLE